MSRDVLLDKIKGGWAGQTIGCAYGGPTEFCYRGVMIPDDTEIKYPEHHLQFHYDRFPGLFDDVYMDLTFVKVFCEEGLDASAESMAKAFAYAPYPLWHANQQARYNIMQGIMPPQSGYWKNNPHADCIDYQIESDFAGLMSPGMPNAASKISDKVKRLFPHEPLGSCVSLSIGISIFPEHGKKFEDLYRAADTALYHVKEHGRDSHKVYSPDLKDLQN